MSAGQKNIDDATVSLTVADGEIEVSRVYINEHAFVPEEHVPGLSAKATRDLRHWREESGKLHEKVRGKDDEIAKLREALKRIERWDGEFPETGKFWPDGTPTSYSFEYGSKGERDYMRSVARDALGAKS